MDLSYLLRLVSDVAKTIFVVVMDGILRVRALRIQSSIRAANNLLGMSLNGRVRVSSLFSAYSLCGVAGLHGSTKDRQRYELMVLRPQEITDLRRQ
jgi:hypothetical protein